MCRDERVTARSHHPTQHRDTDTMLSSRSVIVGPDSGYVLNNIVRRLADTAARHEKIVKWKLSTFV
jgi:hypothetical protein